MISNVFCASEKYYGDNLNHEYNEKVIFRGSI